MTPYYTEAGITIYHGDCREILPQLGRFDLLLTDPPYGIGLNTDYSRFQSSDVQGRSYIKVHGDDSIMDFSFLWGIAANSVVFGANNWPQQIPFDAKRDGWICWDKRTNEEADKILGSPFEMACVVGRRTYEIVRLQHCGVKNADGDNAGRFHPTQKPIALMQRIALLFKGNSIVDPFCGSGTTLVAAKNLGRRAVGVDIEERYCEIAANRLRQSVLNFEAVS